MSIVRQTNFEYLRILCISLITAMHILGPVFDTENVFNKGMILFVNTLGNTGVTIFILISGFWKIHFKWPKLFKVLFIVWFYSLFTYFGELFLLDKTFCYVEFASSLLPVLSKKYWFITCYIVIYCFSPYLNKIIEVLSKKDYEKLLLIGGFFFFIAPSFFFFEIQNDTGKGVVNLLFVYLLGRYLKEYGTPEWIRKNPWKFLLGSLGSIFLLNTILTLMTGNIILRFARDNNILIISASVTIFYLFSCWSCFSKIGNFIAEFVFPIYLLQGSLIRWGEKFYINSLNSELLIFYFVLMLCFIFIFSIVVELLRRKLFCKVEIKIINFINRKLSLFL